MQRPTDDQIQTKAYQLAQRRPWCTAEQNWLDAQLELQSPWILKWRPSHLRWLGASEKRGWDWIELSLMLSVPVAIALGGWFLSTISNAQQNEIFQSNQKDTVIREYIDEMKGLLLEKNIAREAKQPGTEANGVARALTLTALTQLNGAGPERRSLLFQFLRESNFSILSGVNLSGYDLRATDLGGADLRGSNLSGANLFKANLTGARLSESDIRGADLRQADLKWADLTGADLRGAKFEQTVCPDGSFTNTGCTTE